MMPRKTLSTGFTLLELLVALAIFAIVAAMAYSGLNNVLKAHAQTTEQAESLAKLQMAMHFISRDVQQFVNRPVRNEFGDLQPALIGQENQLALTHAGWRNPAQQQRSELRRVSYFIEDDALWYRYWSILDRAQDSQPLQVKLLDDVTYMRFGFLDEENQWQPTWTISPQATAQDSRLQLIPPRAVELVLDTQRWGEIRRLFVLPELPMVLTVTTPNPESQNQAREVNSSDTNIER